MRKLLWLIPLFFAIPTFLAFAAAWAWVVFGVSLVGPWGIERTIACLAMAIVSAFSAGVVGTFLTEEE